LKVAGEWSHYADVAKKWAAENPDVEAPVFWLTDTYVKMFPSLSRVAAAVLSMTLNKARYFPRRQFMLSQEFK